MAGIVGIEITFDPLIRLAKAAAWNRDWLFVHLVSCSTRQSRPISLVWIPERKMCRVPTSFQTPQGYPLNCSRAKSPVDSSG